jgi:hypothetical protein
MLFKKRKEWNSVANSRDMETKRVRRNADKGRCPLCLEEEDVKHILLECKETKYWREKLIHDKWLNMNREITYRKILKTTNRTHI